MVSSNNQTFAGVKTFSSAPIFSSMNTGQALYTSSSGQVANIQYTAANTAQTLVLRDNNGSAAATNFVSAITTVQSSGSSQLLLTASSTRIQKIIGSNSFTITLPTATSLYAGQIFEIDNNTNQSLPVVNIGSTSIATVLSGAYGVLICADNTSANGIWDVHWLAPTNASWGTNYLAVTGSITSSSLVAAPVISNSNGALTNGSISLSNQVVGNLPLSQTSGSITSTQVNFTNLAINSASSAPALFVIASGAATNSVIIQGVPSTTGNFLQVQQNNTAQFMVLDGNLNFRLFGSTNLTAVAPVDMRPTSQVNSINSGSAARFSAFLGDSHGVGAGVGGGFAVGGIYSTSSASQSFGYIWATKNNASAGDIGGALHFATSNNASGLAQRALDIDSGGNCVFGGNIIMVNSTSGASQITFQVGSGGTTPYTLILPMAQGSSSSSYLKNDGTGTLSFQQTSAPTKQLFTAVGSATYTVPAACTFIKITIVGAGAGGGGTTSGTANSGAGGGGGAGGTVIKWLGVTAGSGSFTYSIGAAGAGGTSGANPGAAGGRTWFSLTTSSMSSGAASAGAAGNASTTTAIDGVGGTGGTGSGGDLNIQGGSGTPGLVVSATTALCGVGGASTFSGTGNAFSSNNVTGASGNNYGGGGNGGQQVNNGGNQAGGPGASGFVLVEEYYP